MFNFTVKRQSVPHINKFISLANMKFIMFLVVLLFSVFGGFSAENWSYKDFNNWPKQCTTGRRQSPVNIITKSVESCPFYKGLILKSYRKKYSAKIQNNGHSVKISLDSQKSVPNIQGRFLLFRYNLEEVHFHWNSEHTINGKYFPLEGHFVHYMSNYSNISEAKQNSRGIVVLTVLYKLEDSDTKSFDTITKKVKDVARNIDKTLDLDEPMSLMDLMPTNLRRYYLYQGSLTTPDCSEVATFIIFKRPGIISYRHYKMLKNITDTEGSLLIRNYRPIQKLNGRRIYST